MYKLISLCCALFLLGVANKSFYAQSDFVYDLHWVSTSTVTTAQSPTYGNATCQGINYTLSTSSSLGFKYQTSGPNGTGAIFPGTSGSTTAIPITISFNTPIENPAIYIRDLDEDNQHDGGPAEEYISGISPAANNVESSGSNPIYLSAGTVTPSDNSSYENNNTAGWIVWSGTLSSISFTYYRAGGTYEFVIDSIRFDCPCPTPIAYASDSVVCPQSEFILHSSFASADAYLWNNNQSGISQTYDTPGTYWVKAFTGSCYNIDSFNIAGIAMPSLNLGPDTMICEGNSITLLVNSQFDQVTWQDGSIGYNYLVNQTGNYSVSATYANCPVTDEIQVIVQTYPVSNLPETAIICEGEIYTASVSSPGATFLWSNGDTDNNANLNEAGIYYVVINNGCITIDTIVLSVTPLPPNPELNDTIICKGSQVSFGSSTFYSDVSYLWWNGSTEPTFTTDEEGTYWLQSFQNGCSRTDTVNLSFYPTIADNISYDSIITKCEGKSILIGANILSPLIDITWDNGDSTDYIATNEAGVYHFTLSTPCETREGTIVVTEERCFCSVYVPNAFTPDGNEHNNTFQVVYDCTFDSFELLIFDRWGEKIYASKDPNDFWDGTYLGRPAQDGVYVYKLTYTSSETSTYEEKVGHVCLLR